MKIALVTIAIGEPYIQQHAAIFMPSQRQYAERHGYDYRIITDYIGPIRHPALISLEKQLICSQPWAADYDYILFIDADILIHPEAPAIHEQFSPGNSIWMVDEMRQPTREERHALQVRNGWEQTPTEYYRLSDIDFETDSIWNTGCIVWQPKLHADFCRAIYFKYAAKQMTHSRWYHHEQAAVNYEYQRAGLIAPLEQKWNAVWALHNMTTFKGTLEEFIEGNYFIHLAGHYDYESAVRWESSRRNSNRVA